MATGKQAQLDGGRFLAELYAKDSVQGAFQQRIINAINKLGSALGANPVGKVQPPPAVNNINISTSGELVHVTLNHNQPVNKGINYFLERDTNPNFSNPHVIHMGPSRSAGPMSLPTKDSTGATHKYYFRAYAQYPGGDPSPHTVFGGALNPASVQLTGSTQMDFLPSTGSGTASPTGQQGGKGFGTEQTSASVIGRQQNSIGAVTPQKDIG
jgi:hypothetical protein